MDTKIPDWSSSGRVIKGQTPKRDDASIRRMLSELPYGKIDGLRDLTDNSLASADQHNMDQVSIEYVYRIDTDSPKNSSLTIRDDAGGIPKDPATGERGIHEAIGLDSPMGYERGEYNRYGLGMKGAIHSIGSLSKIFTYSIYEDEPYVVPGPWSLENFDIQQPPTGTAFDFPMGDHGTIIEIDNLNESMWSQRPKQTARSLRRKLEAIYRHALADTAWAPVKMNAKFIVYKDGEKVDEQILRPAWPPKFDYESGMPLDGNEFHTEITVEASEHPGVKGTFRLSYAPDNEVYKTHGDSWYDEKGHPYTGDGGAGISHQGIDFVFKGRVIEHNKLFDMAILDKEPNSGYNLVTGEAHIEGIEVSTIKNGLEENEALKDLFETMMERVEEEFDPTYFQYDRSTGEEAEEAYMNYLKNGEHGYDVGYVENSVKISGASTDVVANIDGFDSVIEVKASKIKRKHVWQAFSYAAELTESDDHPDYNHVLIAGSSATKEAKIACEKLNNQLAVSEGYNFRIVKHEDFLSHTYYEEM